MTNETINIYKDAKALSEGFTSFLQTEMEDKESISISLSGGSTPKTLFQYWAECCNNLIEWQKMCFFWGDERCVPPDDPLSNYGMTKKFLFDFIEKITPSHIHRIHGENDIKDELRKYEGILSRELPKHNELPCFDIMMLGLGDDGHTASIFPDQIELWESRRNCVEAVHPETKMKRISLTGRIINNSNNIAFLVTGKNKARKVKEIIGERDKFMNLYPAARVNPTHGNLYWFLDEEVASLL
ncbi:MAG TPA: 6-phosphogluconolactonase [Dysgonomonas sp.]|nr:6-phosphogluconolactonase [Dysgonomonas sp.]